MAIFTIVAELVKQAHNIRIGQSAYDVVVLRVRYI